MANVLKLTMTLAIAYVSLPLSAEAYPIVSGTAADSLICYFQTSDGKTLDLSSLCRHPDDATPVAPDPTVTVDYYGSTGNALLGQVTNKTSQPITSITIDYEVLDNQGKVIDAGLFHNRPDTPIAPGASITVQQPNNHPGATIKVLSVDWQS
jgi:hypothetical protein